MHISIKRGSISPLFLLPCRLLLSSPGTSLICPMKVICDARFLRRTTETYFQPDPLLRHPYNTDSTGCSACLALEHTMGFINCCYPDADILCRSLSVLPCDLVGICRVDCGNGDWSVHNTGLEQKERERKHDEKSAYVTPTIG